MTEKPEQERPERDIILNYVGKQVVMELGDVKVPISSGYLEKYDGRFLLIKDHKRHKHDVHLSTAEDPHAGNPRYDPTSPESVESSLPSLAINVNHIASITSLDDVLEARKVK